VLIASTSLCKVFRYWIDGPKKGRTEILIDELPGNPDNINRASDGTYWLALVGIRTPTSTSPRASRVFGCAWSSRCRPTNGWRRR